MRYELMIVDVKMWKKDCALVPRERLQQIFKKIRALADDPWAGNVQVKQLKNYEIADFRLRVGEYRVLFNKDEEGKVIHLLRILHRSKLY